MKKIVLIALALASIACKREAGVPTTQGTTCDKSSEYVSNPGEFCYYGLQLSVETIQGANNLVVICRCPKEMK